MGVDFAMRLRITMESRYIRAAWLAQKMGVNRSTITRWRRGKIVPARGEVDRIAALLEVQPEWLLFGEGHGRRDDLAELLPHDGLRMPVSPQEGVTGALSLDDARQRFIEAIAQANGCQPADVHLRYEITPAPAGAAA